MGCCFLDEGCNVCGFIFVFVVWYDVVVFKGDVKNEEILVRCMYDCYYGFIDCIDGYVVLFGSNWDFIY